MANKTIRVFTVEVTGCNRCPNKMYSYLRDDNFCGADNSVERFETASQNEFAITPSCPRYAESFVKEIKE